MSYTYVTSCPRLQADVSHRARLLHGAWTGNALQRAHGHSSGGQQALPVRLPPLLVAGGREGGPSTPDQVGDTLSAALIIMEYMEFIR